MVPCRKLGGAASTVSCPMTMILCGWIVLILQVQSMFNCPPSYDDPCCPGKFCCNDGLNGCCNDNRQFYVPELSAYTVGDHECVCWPSRRSSGMCHFNLKINTATRALIPQLTSLILYSCKSKLDCWSLFCSLARTVIAPHWSCPDVIGSH